MCGVGYIAMYVYVRQIMSLIYIIPSNLPLFYQRPGDYPRRPMRSSSICLSPRWKQNKWMSFLILFGTVLQHKFSLWTNNNLHLWPQPHDSPVTNEFPSHICWTQITYNLLALSLTMLSNHIILFLFDLWKWLTRMEYMDHRSAI